MRLLRAREDFGERGLGAFGRQAAQHVVGAELDDQRVRPRRHAPVVAREPVVGGFSGNAGVGDLDVVALGAQGAFAELRETPARRQAVTRRQAVAERDEMQRARLRPGRRRTARDASKRRAAWTRRAKCPYEALPPREFDVTMSYSCRRIARCRLEPRATGAARVHILRKVSLTIGARRGGRAGRRLGLGQIDAADDDRRARAARQRRRSSSTASRYNA